MISTPGRLSACTVALLCCILLCHRSCPALEPDSIGLLRSENACLVERLQALQARREMYRWSRFPPGPVLRSGTVLQATASVEGRLAFCTDNRGLVFYDGDLIEVVDARAGLPDDFVTAYAPVDSFLGWVGTASGLALYDHGRVSVPGDIPAGLREAPVSCLLIDEAGVLWIGTPGTGLWRLDNNTWEHLTAGVDNLPAGTESINDLALDPFGRGVWAATAGGGVLRFDRDRIDHHPEPLGTGSAEVYCLAADRDGLVWAGTAQAGAGFLAGTGWRGVNLPAAPGSGVIRITPFGDGNLFFGSTDGAFLYDAARGGFARLPMPEELSPFPVVSAIEWQGALWLSPSDRGLHAFDLSLLSPHGLEDGLPDLEIFSLAQSQDGTLWCGTRNGAARMEGHRWTTAPAAYGLPDPLVTCIRFGKADTSYFGTHAGVAILTRDGIRVLDRDYGLLSNTVNSLEIDPRGGLWIATEGGLALFRNDSLRIYTREHGLPANQVQAVLAAPDRTIWAATRQGLARLEMDLAFVETLPGPAHFTALAHGPDGTLWAATWGRGVWRRSPRGDWENLTTDQGLGADEVLSVTAFSRGRTAFGTSLGLSIHDGEHWRSYGPTEGLEPGAVTNVFTATDSSLWLSVRERSLSRFNPDRFAPPETWIGLPGRALSAMDRNNSPVFMTAAPDTLPTDGLNGVRSRYYVAGEWYLPSPVTGLDTIRVDSLSVSFHAGTPWWPGESGAFRFSWKLDNGPWSDFRPSGGAGLSGLGRGPHSLFVRAKSPHLQVDPTPAVYRFHVDVPTLWSDWRLYAAAILLILAAGGTFGRRQLAWYAGGLAHRSFHPVEPNPFRPNNPSIEPGLFNGRDQILAGLEEIQRPPGNTSVIVRGDEKTGVSSLLLASAERARTRGWFVLYLDLGEGRFRDLRAALARLEEMISESAPESDTAESTKPGAEPESLTARLRGIGGPALVLLDNAERLASLSRHESELCARFSSSLRELFLGEDGINLVFGVHDSESLRRNLPRVHEMSRIITLGGLDAVSARETLERPLYGRAALHRSALDSLAAISSGHPFLLQSLGREAVELMNRERTNRLTPELAERSALSLLGSPPALIPDRWDELSRNEKLLYAAVVTLQGTTGGRIEVGTADAAMVLNSHHSPLIEEELIKAAASLSTRGLLKLDAARGRISMDDSLFARWVRSNRPLESVDPGFEYNPGEVLHRAGEAGSQSFRLEELVERLLGVLRDELRLDWAAFVPLGESETPERPFTVGPGAPANEHLPSPETLLGIIEKARRGSFVSGEEGEREQPGEAAPGPLTVPVFLRGGTAGAFLFGPREGVGRWSRRDRSLLETVAEQAAVAMENVRLYEQETERERLRQELDAARRMQLAILPERSFQAPGIEIFAHIAPATEVGGDYFDYRRLDGDRLAFAIGDVSGHGISAGTLVSMTKSCLYNQFRVDCEVEPVMSAMNEMVRGTLSRRLLMTFCYVVFETGLRRMRYSVAGHPFPYRLCPDGELVELEMSAYPLGVSDKAAYGSRSLDYSAGDALVFYSDGIVEGVDPSGEQYGFNRFEESIRRHAGLSAEAMNSGLIDDFREFSRGIPQEDDITLVIIRTG